MWIWPQEPQWLSAGQNKGQSEASYYRFRILAVLEEGIKAVELGKVLGGRKAFT